MTYKVVLTDQVFPDTATEEAIFAHIGAELSVLADASTHDIALKAADADALLTTYAAIDAQTIAALQRCKVIARYGIGVDNIDLEAAKAAGITVTNVPDYCVEEVADHTVSLLLALARKLLPGHSSVLGGGWGIKPVRPLHRIRGQRLGLIGFGNIGRAVATRAVTFGFDVMVYDPYLAPADAGPRVTLEPDLEAILTTSDAISVHAPLTPVTRGLIDGDALRRMKPGAVLVNTSRGPIVDSDAVVEALRSGHLGGAGLDVFETEPPNAKALQDVPNLIATPHSAFYSEEAINESQTKAATCIVRVLQGEEPPYRIV